MEYLRTKQPHLVTQQFAQKFTNTAIRHKVYQAKFVETLRDLMDFFDRGIAGIVGEKAKQLFEFSINSITTTMEARDGQTGRLQADQLADLTALLKFQKALVDGAMSSAGFIVPYHYNDAMNALQLVSTTARTNPTLSTHVEQLKASWEALHMESNNAERDDRLDRLRAKMGT